MTRDEMEALMSRCHTAFAKGDIDTLAAAHAEDCVMESPTAGGVITGRAAIAKIYAAWVTAFPDLSLSPPDLLIDGNRAAQSFTLSGTDTGGFMGMPATGKPFRVPLVWLVKAENGVITHSQPIYDFGGMLIQIGVLKVKSM